MTSKQFSILLNAFVFPGLGQIYLKQKVRGALLAGIAILILGSFLIRLASRIFYLLNDPHQSSNGLKSFYYIKEAWHIDQRVLLSLLVAWFLIWSMAILDLVISQRESKRCQKSSKSLQ